MTEQTDKLELSPVAEGMVGALIGAVLGGGLYFVGFISAPAILGVVIGMGIASWFNAWRRAKKAKEQS